MRLLTINLILLLASAAYGQDRCGTVEFTKWRELQNPRLESIDQFENWISGKLRSPRKSAQRFHQTQSTYTIPVVVHVIHNGEPVGTGTNISDAQIQSQISVLNEDFKRLNADATNTPAQFQSVAGTMDVEFVLALQDPEGLATTGIVRVQGTKPSWQQADDYQLKSLSYWRSDRYLNIWVCNLIDTKGIVGYGQFP
ncbi:MAG: Pregnancy-associated plasma protein-A, partial [Cyclobacteriaceae bacterium]